MKQGSLLKLPKFQVLQPEGTFYADPGWGNFSAFDWTGKLISPQSMLHLPLIYHRGTYLTSYGYDPEQTEPLPDPPFFDSEVQTPPPFKQYGDPYSKKNKVPRIPNACLYDRELGDITHGAQVEDVIAGAFEILTEKNVFTGEIFGETPTPFLMQPMPITDIDSNTHGYISDISRWDGGNLLVIMAVRTDTGVLFDDPPNTGVFASTLAYTDQIRLTWGVGVPFTDPPVVSGNRAPNSRFTFDLLQLERCFPKFNKYECIVYLVNESDPSGPGPSFYADEVMTPIFQGMRGPTSQFNVTIKGPFRLTDDKRDSIVQDIANFFRDV